MRDTRYTIDYMLYALEQHFEADAACHMSYAPCVPYLEKILVISAGHARRNKCKVWKVFPEELYCENEIHARKHGVLIRFTRHKVFF